jgi:hypothetical protein
MIGKSIPMNRPPSTPSTTSTPPLVVKPVWPATMRSLPSCSPLVNVTPLLMDVQL